jgi:hydroxycarboxylate dehydrogenase B
MTTIKLTADQWRDVCKRAFVAWGAAEDTAVCVAESLVGGDLAGMHSHGVIRILEYCRYIKAGSWSAAARPEVTVDTPVTTVVDGHYGFGQPAAYLALDKAIEKARAMGIAAASVIHAGHIGRLGEYAEKAAAARVVALVMANSAGHGGAVVPFGGAERVFSTNPISAGVPAAVQPPFVMDFATSTVAAGKFDLMPDLDTRIPAGWAVNAQGQPATTVREFREGGGLVPFGGHKGYALGLFVELICGALTGSGVPAPAKEAWGPGYGGNAAFMIALDVAHFNDPDRFTADVEALFGRLHAVRPAPGFDRVMVPGEPEAAQRALQAREGIAVDEATWDKIVAVCAERGESLSGFRTKEAS